MQALYVMNRYSNVQCANEINVGNQYAVDNIVIEVYIMQIMVRPFRLFSIK